MGQRILAIDSLVNQHRRIYLRARKSIGHVFPVLKRVATGAYQLDYSPRYHSWLIKQLCQGAKQIYCHSVFGWHHLASHQTQLTGKLFWDVHGSVPEETVFQELGETLSKEHEQAEAALSQTASTVITVSEAMQSHLQKKHSFSPTTHWLTVPIIDSSLAQARRAKEKHEPYPKILYAGGLQAWQNIPLAIKLLKTQQIPATFLLSCPDELSVLLEAQQATHLLENQLSVASVPKVEVFTHCQKHHYGLLLRDDHVLNRVACPTKLLEYLAYGLVPIVKSQYIGDMAAWGVQSLSIEAVIQGQWLSEEAWQKASQQNQAIAQQVLADAELHFATLGTWLNAE